MTSPSLGVVVTNYNTWDLVVRGVENVRTHGAGADRVLVVDDASATPPPLGLDAEVLANPENLGLVRSLNRGLRAVGTDLAVLFDSDAWPLGPFAGRLCQLFADDPQLAIVGFVTVDEAGHPTASSETEPDAASLVLGQRLHALWLRLFPGRGPQNVFTCAMALRLEAFRELGGFDEAFDWLDLDHDLCMRARRAGWRVIQAPDLVAFHRGGGTPQSTSARVLRFYKTRWLLLRKLGKIRHPRLVRALVLARLRAEYLLLALAGRLLFEDRAALADKLAGRRTVLRYCAENYQ
ncbi:MAG TPA: glycosyltransferase [Thermoanaerobaculia bacterium]|nr:glycosyltransferase [Thermoanaerobaculia bacterium]